MIFPSPSQWICDSSLVDGSTPPTPFSFAAPGCDVNSLTETGTKDRSGHWEYDQRTYKRRNEVERLFRRLKGFRRIFSRFDKLDVLFLGFILFALIFEALR